MWADVQKRKDDWYKVDIKKVAKKVEEKSRQGSDDHPGESRIMENKKIESMGRGVKCIKNISENYN